MPKPRIDWTLKIVAMQVLEKASVMSGEEKLLTDEEVSRFNELCAEVLDKITEMRTIAQAGKNRFAARCK